MEIMSKVMAELESREAYKHEIYAPYYVCSYATHCFNLANQKNEIYWESKRLPNMRLHCLFVSPAGYMKSYYLGTMGGDKYAIFKEAGIQVGYEQSLTEAGFIGTISNMNGVNIPTEGAAMTFRHGMLLIDEFSAITNAMKVQYNAQMDSQLLAALDHGNVYKRLGAGKIEYKTNLSLWAGVQPARYDLTSGLGRRMCFLLFLPTRYDNEQLMETMARTRNIRPDEGNMQDLWRSINAWYNDMYKIEKVEFDDSVLKAYKNMKLFSYESSYFDRLILGYHLATYGPEKHMCVSADNKDLMEVLTREKKWRDQIMQGVDFVQIERLIQSAGVPCEGDKYKITKRELVSEAIMVGWNAQQVHEMLIQMLKFGIISVKGNEVTLEN